MFDLTPNRNKRERKTLILEMGPTEKIVAAKVATDDFSPLKLTFLVYNWDEEALETKHSLLNDISSLPGSPSKMTMREG